jgi:hypothetical protein
MVPLLVRLTYPQITQITQIKAKKVGVGRMKRSASGDNLSLENRRFRCA